MIPQKPLRRTGSAAATGDPHQGRSDRSVLHRRGLVTQLLEKREDRQLERFQRQPVRLHLIVLDELGHVLFLNTGAELLFELVSRAYLRTSLIMTTNLPFEAFPEVMGSEQLTGALLDPLTHRIHILAANGESYRLRESKSCLKRRRSLKCFVFSREVGGRDPRDFQNPGDLKSGSCFVPILILTSVVPSLG